MRGRRRDGKEEVGESGEEGGGEDGVGNRWGWGKEEVRESGDEGRRRW